MEIKPISANDVNEMTNLWNRNIGDRFPMKEQLLLQNSLYEKNVEPTASFSAWDGGKLIGFIVAKRYREHYAMPFSHEVGWIQVLIVDQPYRQTGMGSHLLESALNALKKHHIKKVHLGRDLWHYFPGVPIEDEETIQWFLRRGFERNNFIDVDLVRHFSEHETREKLENGEARFDVINISQKDQLLSFLQDAFPGRWLYETIKYFELGGTGRDYVALWVDDEIKGFCRLNDEKTPFIGCNVHWSPLFKGELGGIGPLGVHPDLRGKNLGLDIVKYAINTLYDRGCRHIVIDWTGLVDFYGKVNFKVFKEYVPLFKEI